MKELMGEKENTKDDGQTVQVIMNKKDCTKVKRNTFHMCIRVRLRDKK